MKKFFLAGGAAIVIIAVVAALLYLRSNDCYDSLLDAREETELILSNIPGAHLTPYTAGKDLQHAEAVRSVDSDRTWLSKANYFLKAAHGVRSFFYPVPILGYRGGPDESGTFNVTIRLPGTDSPHGSLPELRDYVFIPSGNFLFGHRHNPQEPHYVWLGCSFINPTHGTR